MKYAVEMSSGVTINTPRFMKSGSGIQKLILGGGGEGQKHTLCRLHKSPLATYATK
jgi:hypothetical protein